MVHHAQCIMIRVVLVIDSILDHPKETHPNSHEFSLWFYLVSQLLYRPLVLSDATVKLIYFCI